MFCCFTVEVKSLPNLPRVSFSFSCCLSELLAKSLGFSFYLLTAPSEESSESGLSPAELFLGFLP